MAAGRDGLGKPLMAKLNLRLKGLSLLAVALLGGGYLLPLPASAQFFGSFDQRPNRPPPQQRGFFGGGFPFFGGPGSGPFQRPPQQQPSEALKAPAPRKYETPPTSTVAVIGDSMADWLAYGLEEALSDTPEMGVVRYIKTTSGLVRYDPKNDQLEWGATIKDVLATDKPSAIVVMLGLNDRMPLHDKAPPKPGTPPAPGTPTQDKTPDKATDAQPPSDAAKPNAEQAPIAASEPTRQGPAGSYDFHTDKWAELYSKRIDDMITALKGRGVPVLWVGLPSVSGTRSTSDMSYLDELYRARAERAGIVYVDIWDGFVDESGRYVSQGPDFEGQTRRLRTSDGVHFTKAGAVKLAQYVAQALHRVMNNRLVPVALPIPADTPKPGVNGPRPVVGPVLPLTVSVGSDGSNLLGDNGRSSPANTDPVATRVLTHGDPITPPSGRADDFSWPRSDANGNAEIESQPPTPGAPAKGPVAKPDPKKADAAKGPAPAAKPSPNPPQAPAAARPAPRASLDGGLR
jgi:lysophospholipase L1-like esterase